MSTPLEDKTLLQDRSENSDVTKVEISNDKMTLKRKHPTGSLVSVIIPVYNAEQYLEEAFVSIAEQTYRPLEVVCFNDCSTDGSWVIIQSWKDKFKEADIIAIMLSSDRDTASGPGYGRNQAIQNSHGDFLCHLGMHDCEYIYFHLYY